MLAPPGMLEENKLASSRDQYLATLRDSTPTLTDYKIKHEDFHKTSEIEIKADIVVLDTLNVAKIIHSNKLMHRDSN